MIPVWVINLDRSPQRWASIESSCSGTGIVPVRIAAVDALGLTEAEIDCHVNGRRNEREYFAKLKPGEVACFLSHQKAWRAFLQSDHEHVCILEDDVEWDRPPQSVLAALVQAMGSATPQMVKLYASRPVKGQIRSTSNEGVLVTPVVVPLGTQAQLINRACAQRLLDAFEQFWEPIDVSLQRWWDTGVRVDVWTPNLVNEVSAALGGTTLRAPRSLPLRLRLRRELMRPWFRMRRWWMSHWKSRVQSRHRG
jgi:GR25 family glycosyltransferase involved in LPS biosynthesis